MNTTTTTTTTASTVPAATAVDSFLTAVAAGSGIPVELYAAHHCHVLTMDDDGRIASDVVFCGGRWSASLLAEMAGAS